MSPQRETSTGVRPLPSRHLPVLSPFAPFEDPPRGGRPRHCPTRSWCSGVETGLRASEGSTGLSLEVPVRNQLDPSNAEGGTGNATLDKSLTKAVMHERLLMFHGVPDLGHDEISIRVETCRMHQHSVGPITFASRWVDSEFLVHGVVFHRSHSLKFQDQFSGHFISSWV